ncbi:MAG TPA: putative O-glycosylation ligase, exosortase A system-associated [Stellaceae bacterium]
MRGLLLFVVFFALLPLVVIKGPFIGILMWFWISLMSPQDIAYGAFTTIPYAMIVAITTLVTWLLSRSEPKFPPLGKTTVLLFLLMFWFSVTSVFGIAQSEIIFDRWQLAEKMLLMTLVAYTLTTTRARLDQLIVVCVFSIAFFGVKGGLFSLMTGGQYRVRGPDQTMIGDNNDLGVALTMILPLLFYLRERYGRTWYKWPLLAIIGLTIVGDVFTYSRGGLLAVIAMTGVLWLRARKKIATLVLIVLAAVGIWNFAPQEWVDRMVTIESYQKDESAESRIYIWKLAFAMAQKSPILGGGFHWSYDPAAVNRTLTNTGMPSLTRPRAPHSIWFEMLGEQGFVGLAIFVAILASLALDAQWLIRKTRRRPELLWANNLGRMLQVALVGYCAGGSFVSLATYDGFYVLVIIGAAAHRIVAAELASVAVADTSRAMVVPRPAAGGFAPRPAS